MKIMKKIIKKHRHLVFMDFEGTQYSHELIAFGAVKVTLDKNYNIIRVNKGIKYYVKAKNKIGSFVKKLTSIDEEILEKQGITFKEALVKIKKYCGLPFAKDTSFCFFGTHDLRILSKSYEWSPDADKDILKVLTKNAIDLSAVLAQFVRDDRNNPLSLIHGLELFDIPLSGEPHDPLIDSIHLMFLYKGMMNNPDKLYSEYLKVLPKQKVFPQPVKAVINKLIDGNTVTPDDFKKFIKDFIG